MPRVGSGSHEDPRQAGGYIIFPMNILALDVGTSSVKAAFLDQATGEPLVPPARVHYELDHPDPDAAEIPPQRLREAVWHAARQAVADAPNGATVEGVGLSCLTPALVLLGADDEPLSPIWIHLDRRSRPLARKVWAEVGDEFLKTTGNRPLPGGMSVLCYGQQAIDDPTLKGRVRHYLHANGWLGFLLTGERRFDPANASFTGLFNTVTDQQWSPRWCDYFGVERGWLPEVVSGDTTIGGLRKEVAEKWGLPAGLPVKLGTADTSSAMLAARMKPGDLLHSVGTTHVLALLVTHPKPDPRRLTRLFGVGDEFVYVTHNPVGGAALEWLHQLCFRDVPADEFFDHTVIEATHRETEVRLDPPFLGGDRLEIEPAHAAFRDLTLAIDRLDLLAALLAAMRRGHRQAFAALGLAEGSVRRVVLTGGGAEAMRGLLPGYASSSIETIEEGALRGVARLFDRRDPSRD